MAHPRAQSDAHINIKHYVEITQTAERAKFDLVFLADGVATARPTSSAKSLGAVIAHFEPITLLSALAMVTEHIGLIATMSTSYTSPITWRANSPRSITSAAGVQDGTSSPRVKWPRRSISTAPPVSPS